MLVVFLYCYSDFCAILNSLPVQFLDLLLIFLYSVEFKLKDDSRNRTILGKSTEYLYDTIWYYRRV